MIEILFSDSACGSLQMAQRFGEGEYMGVSIGVIGSHSEDGSKPTKEELEAAQREFEEKHRLAWENAVPLGGNPADVYGFSLALSVGDISEDQPGAKRRQVLERLYCMYPDVEGSEVADSFMCPTHKALVELRERLAAGETMRIWYSDWPEDMCGLYWLTAQLREWKTPAEQVFLVKLPEWESDGENTLKRISHWGELEPQEWHRYLDLQVPAPLAFVSACASQWRALQKENAALRAVLNGRLVSVPENIYDSFILREIEAVAAEFQEAMIIGRVLGKYQLGIGDGWIALRIEEMIRAGNLSVVTAASKDVPLYHRILRKRTL
jgi:hypothetical protein